MSQVNLVIFKKAKGWVCVRSPENLADIAAEDKIPKYKTKPLSFLTT